MGTWIDSEGFEFTKYCCNCGNQQDSGGHMTYRCRIYSSRGEHEIYLTHNNAGLEGNNCEYYWTDDSRG